jgi:lipopolysaccharide transport system permease protein
MNSETKNTLVIEAGKSERHYWRDLWRYRELFYFLAWRDILVRYKQTTIGFLWAIIRPLLTTVVLVVVFGKIAKLPSDGVPYPILVVSAILPWQFVANAFTSAGNSLVANANMISKIYFPRLIIPTSTLIVSLVDFLIGLLILAAVMIWYGYYPDIRIVVLPLLVVFAALTALSIGLWTAALNVKYRDFRYLIPFVVQFGLYVSPVGFSSSVIPDKWRLIYSLNPMVGIIDGFRWAIIGGKTSLYLPGFGLSIALVTIFMWSGLIYFRRTEKSFADVI